MTPRLRVDERRCQVRRVIFRWQRAQRRRTLWRQRAVRTAKPCGPDRRCYGQALADAALASTGAVPATFAGVREARRNSAPGRARHKPSNHRAGKAVCWASPVCCCAVLPAHHLRAVDRGCEPAPGLPCALLATRRRVTKQSSGKQAARMRSRVCAQPRAVIVRLDRTLQYYRGACDRTESDRAFLKNV